MKRITLILWLLLSTAIWTFAYDFKSGDLYYNITSNYKVEVTYQKFSPENYSGLTSAVIPESVTYNGTTYSVTSIGEYAFSRCSGLTSVTISNSVTSIESSAFSDCSGLTSVVWNAKSCKEEGRANDTPFYDIRSQITSFTFSDEVEHIPAYLCYGMTSLTSVTIPNSVTSIGWGAFSGCSGLTSVTIGNSVTSIGEWAFSGCSGLTSITIPSSVTNIGYEVFYGCSGLTSVLWNAKSCQDFGYSVGPFSSICSQITSFTFGDKVEHVPAYLCYGMESLTSVIIPNSVTSIGYDAFSGVPNIVYAGTATGAPWGAKNMNGYADGYFVYSDSTKTILLCCSRSATGVITIPNSVTSVGDYAFYDCSSLASVTIGNSVTSIGDYAFYDCSSLASVTIGNSVTSIGDYAFYDCSSLASVTIGNSVTSIGESAFMYCSGLTSITIPNSVTSIGSGAFRYCSGLTSITIPNSVTSIGSGAFRYCSGLTSITIPNGVTSIGSSAFEYCSGLTSVTIPNSVTSIGSGAFMYCSGLTSITIPNSVTSIGSGAFMYCSGLTSITIPNSVTSIGNSAFMYCSGLTSITIPNSVTSIDKYAFSGCTSLTSVTIPNSVTSIDKYAFSGCTSLTSVTIPNSVTSIGWYAFSDCGGLTSVTIGNGVTSIDNTVFKGCSGLISVAIGSGITSIGDYAFSDCINLTSVVWNVKNDTFLVMDEEINTPFYRYIEYDKKHNFDLRSHITTFIFGDSVQHIPAYICDGMNNLASVTIGNRVTSIGDHAFDACGGLTKTNYTGDIADWYKIDFGTNANPIDYSRSFFINDTLLTDLVIPEGIDTINDLFRYDTCLISVTIPNSVTSIGERAFSGCIGLTSVTIPNSVTSIGAEAFMGTPWLANMQDGVIYMGRVLYTYKGDMPQGTNIIVKNGIVSITEGAFSECQGLTSITISNSVTSIGEFAFYDCSSLTSITIPQNAISIGTYSLRGCTNLTSVTWNALDYTKTNPFYCELVGDTIGFDLRKQITSFVCGDSVYAIIPGICYQMTNLDTLACPAMALESEDVNMENYPKALKYVKLLNGEFTETTIQSILSGSRKTIRTLDLGGVSNTEIPDEAFREFYKMDTLVLPAQLTKIPYKAVSECVALQSIVVPEGVTEIEYGAFSGCSGLQTLTLPSTLQSIADNGFASCSALQEMRVHAQTPPTVFANTFSGVKRTIPVYVPQSAYNDYTAAEVWKEFFIQSDVADSVENTPADTRNQSVRKVFRNGQICILRGDKTYTLTGEEVR